MKNNNNTLLLSILLYLTSCYLTIGFLENSHFIGIIRPSFLTTPAVVNTSNSTTATRPTSNEEVILATITSSSYDYKYKSSPSWHIYTRADHEDMYDVNACYGIVSECVACLCDTLVIQMSCMCEHEHEHEWKEMLGEVCAGLEKGAIRRRQSVEQSDADAMNIVLHFENQQQYTDAADSILHIKDFIVDKLSQQSNINIYVVGDLSEVQEFASRVVSVNDIGESERISNVDNHTRCDEFARFICLLIQKLNTKSAFKSFIQEENVRLEMGEIVGSNMVPLENFPQIERSDMIDMEVDIVQEIEAVLLTNDEKEADILSRQLESEFNLSDTNVDSLESEFSEAVEVLLYDLQTLERKQDDAILDSSRPPVLEFGQEANSAIRKLWKVLNNMESKYKKSSNALNQLKTLRSSALSQYVFSESSGSVFNLLHHQLSNVREYFGQRYESSIENIVNKYTQYEEQGQRIAAVATETVEGFKAASKHAIPALLQNEESFKALENDMCDGLVRDLMIVTEEQQDIDRDWSYTVNLEDNDGDEDDSSEAIQAKPTKWYKKLAARALVLGVNYIQGLILLHGLRQAAAERDKMMPKFPLF